MKKLTKNEIYNISGGVACTEQGQIHCTIYSTFIADNNPGNVIVGDLCLPDKTTAEALLADLDTVNNGGVITLRCDPITSSTAITADDL